MPQSLSQSLSQQMRMEQRLTPQLIQSMAVLQKPVAELETYINDALESNAALEVAENGADSGGLDEAHIVITPAGAETVQPDSEQASFARLANFSREYDLDFNDSRSYSPRRTFDDGERDPKMAALANTVERETNLNDHLLEQWLFLDLDDETRRAGQAVIQHIDPDGYLRVRLEEIATHVRPPVPVEALKRALSELQRLDPPGVGARDIVECLLLQLDRLPGDNHVERTLIQRHLDDLAHNRLPSVARATGFSLGEISEALRVMRSSLILHPGTLVGDRSVPAIRPDVIVEHAETGGGLTVRLARGNLPKLRIRDDLLTAAKSRENGKDLREFARRHVEAATAIIDAVQFRRSRLLEVARAIVEKQRDFFDIGPDGLKVLRMSDLAVELQCDPSTISRTVADKYLQAPRGIYPLRYFFTGGTETEEGESVGWDRVKGRVRELVDSEDRRNPLSDDQISTRLKQEGVAISRRTVAKYRQQLDIPSTRQRRQF